MRRGIAAGATLVMFVLGTITAAPAQGAPTGTTVDHWGSFFGDRVKGNSDLLAGPTTISVPGTVQQLGTSNSTQYALLTDGTLWAWGQGDRGELGDGDTVNSYASAVQVQFPSGVTIASIPTDVMPYDTGLAIDTTGHVWGWGYDQGGELCLGNKAEYDEPVELPLSDVGLVAGAGDHASYDSDGTLYACGDNANGDLGTGDTTPSLVPVAVDLPASADVTDVVASYEDSGALLSSGAYYDWGLNAQGQVGNGQTTAVDTPYHVSFRRSVVQVAQGASTTGNGQTLVMLEGGSLRAWGDNTWGQLGDGKRGKYKTSPIAISPPSGVTYRTLATGGWTSYAISTTGTVYAWGGNARGEAGIGSTSFAVPTPTAVDSGASLLSATAGDVAVGG